MIKHLTKWGGGASKVYPQECGQVVEKLGGCGDVLAQNRVNNIGKNAARKQRRASKCGTKIKSSGLSAATQIVLWLLAFVLSFGVMFVCNGKQIARDNASIVGADSATVHTISNEAELTAFASDGASYSSVKLTNEIEMTTESWDGISGFSGTFDGDNHIITFKNEVTTSGLFESIGGYSTIKNVGVNYLGGVKNTTETYFGGILSQVSTSGDIVIENCFVTGSISMEHYNPKVGGILGQQTNDVYGNINIKNCYTDFDLISITINMGGYGSGFGGIVGQDSYEYVHISNCYTIVDEAILDITSQESSGVYTFGGIMGDGEPSNVTDCFAIVKSLSITSFIYQSLYMVTTIDGETVTKKAYVPTSDTLGITLSVSLPAQAVGNWVTV